MWRNNSGLFLLGFAFVVLCMVGVWAIRYRGPELDAVARGEAQPSPASMRPTPPRPGAMPAVSRPIQIPSRGINRMGRDTSPQPGAALDRAVQTAVRVGDDGPRGLINGEQIRVAVAAVEPLWTQCFEDAKERYTGPQLATVKFTLKADGADGRFESGELVDTTVDDPWVKSCLLESLLDAKYTAPANSSELVVQYPFYFEAE